MQKITVVIPTIGRMFWVVQLVNALLSGGRQPDEIIIVDQTPAAERSPIAYSELDRIASSYSIVKYLYQDRPGLTIARNLGAMEGHGDILIFLDDDVFVPAYFLRKYSEIFENGDIHAATGMILVHSKDDGTFKPLAQKESLPTTEAMIRGGNFGVRRKVYFHLGGMDERYVRACNYEDWDLAWRLYKGGFKAVWDPGPWCYHAATGDGGGRWVNFHTQADRAYNESYFFLTHPEALRGKGGLWRYLLHQFIFNRSHLQRPWRVPQSAWLLMRAYRSAVAAAKAGPLLPLRTEEKGQGVERL